MAYWEQKSHPKFEISVKALIFNNKNGKLLLALDDKGKWDLPGGRLEEETVSECLSREVLEEIGVKITKISPAPKIAELIDYDDNVKRMFLGFVVEVENFDFKPSDENVENRFVSKEEFGQLDQAYNGLKSIIDKLYD